MNKEFRMVTPEDPLRPEELDKMWQKDPSVELAKKMAEANSTTTNKKEGGGNIPPTFGGFGGGNSSSPKGGKSGCCGSAWIGIILSALALLGTGIVWFSTPSKSSVEDLAKKVGENHEAVVVVDERVDQLVKSAKTDRVAVLSASNKAEQALLASAMKSGESCSPEVKKPAGKVIRKKVTTPKAKAPASATAPAPVVAPASVGYELCRLRSDGTARLISDKKTVLSRGSVIAVESQDPRSAQARLSGEDCNAWRARMTDKLVDKTTGGG